jgi:hypothetical protein
MLTMWYPLSANLVLTSLTSGGRSVGIVHSWTQAMEFVLRTWLLGHLQISVLFYFLSELVKRWRGGDTHMQLVVAVELAPVASPLLACKWRAWIAQSVLLAGRQICRSSSPGKCGKVKRKVKLPRNRPWRTIGMWDVKDPTLSRQSAHI